MRYTEASVLGRHSGEDEGEDDDDADEEGRGTAISSRHAVTSSGIRNRSIRGCAQLHRAFANFSQNVPKGADEEWRQWDPFRIAIKMAGITVVRTVHLLGRKSIDVDVDVGGGGVGFTVSSFCFSGVALHAFDYVRAT